MTGPWTLAPDLDEDVFQRRITDLASELGVYWHHETDSRRTKAGWLDLFLCGPQGVAVVELKRQHYRYKPTPEQSQLMARLCESRGVLTGLWRPDDFAHIARVLHRLAGRRPHALLLAEPPVVRYRLSLPAELLPADGGSGPRRRVVGDFSTRADAVAVREHLTNPDSTAIVTDPEGPRP